MGTVWIKELTGGLDVRRLPETTPGGVLVRADNGHITRGGEFETRAAFVPEISLPAGTVGLAHTRTGLVVFGSGPAPAGLPKNVKYQRLQKGGLRLVRIRDWELFEDKIYVVAEFSGGTVAHFLNGAEVSAWQEARARVSLLVDGGSITPAAQARASFRVTGGTAEVINELTSLQVSGTELLREGVTHTGNNATTAAAIAALINAYPTTPGYTAAAAGDVVTLTAVRAGTAANGRTIRWSATGNFTLGQAVPFAGGVNRAVPALTNLTIGGVPVIREPVAWTGDVESMAEAIADAVNSSASDPEYEATAQGGLVTIYAVEAGAARNGLPLVRTVSGALNISFPSGSNTANGADLEGDRYLPADVMLTVREKMYAGAGSILHMSAVQNPAYWTPGGTATNQIGAGFKNIAASNSSSYRITALARYYDRLAVFTPDTVQTWFLDPDPDLVVQTQVLENTGTECPKSVAQFGDADIFYLDTSGIRSLRARDSSNAAATTDIGVPIDDLLTARLARMTTAEKARVIGLINPADKRFWLIMDDEVFVYSYFPNSKVNAWTRYDISRTEGGVRTEYHVSEALAFDRRVFLRAGDTVLCYGGWSRVPVYDDTQAEAWLPMLDANTPTAEKDWRGIDAALTGAWDVSVSFDPLREQVMDVAANLTQTTFGLRRIPVKHRSSHVGLKFRSRGGRAILSSVVVHFDGKADED